MIAASAFKTGFNNRQLYDFKASLSQIKYPENCLSAGHCISEVTKSHPKGDNDIEFSVG